MDCYVSQDIHRKMEHGQWTLWAKWNEISHLDAIMESMPFP